VWLSGMGQQADIITLGHGFVRDGDKVDVVKVAEAKNSPNSVSSNNIPSNSISSQANQ
jgi:multidrug efflux system membrane fusion protein